MYKGLKDVSKAYLQTAGTFLRFIFEFPWMQEPPIDNKIRIWPTILQVTN